MENIRGWSKDPDGYTQAVSNGVFVIMRRNYAPQEERLRSVIARERKAPQVFAEARRNLKNPPRVFTEVALQQLPDVIDFFRKDVPDAFLEVKDPKLLAEFKASNQVVVDELRKYETFLKNTLLPASKGDFRLGAENFRKKLLYEEMVDIPLDHLLKIGYEDLHRNQAAFKATAAQIGPKQAPEQLLASLQKDHPAPGELLQGFRDLLGGLLQFVEDKKIISVPSQVPPTVEETPAFSRALTIAALDSPGPYETKAAEAIFQVTLPDPDWSPKKTEEWMETFSYNSMANTAVHEVYPGHYMQYIWLQRFPTKTRKLLYCDSNSEGWAHYAEEMMLDEGYGNGSAKRRLGQLHDALLRNARFIAGIEMHTGKMTLAQATQFFVEQAYQPHAVAEEEAKRGTSDPTYLVYTLGKLQILKLREDYKKRMGDRFSLLEFHDRFMGQGGMPLKVVRKAMLGDDSPTL